MSASLSVKRRKTARVRTLIQLFFLSRIIKRHLLYCTHIMVYTCVITSLTIFHELVVIFFCCYPYFFHVSFFQIGIILNVMWWYGKIHFNCLELFYLLDLVRALIISGFNFNIFEWIWIREIYMGDLNMIWYQRFYSIEIVSVTKKLLVKWVCLWWKNFDL